MQITFKLQTQCERIAIAIEITRFQSIKIRYSGIRNSSDQLKSCRYFFVLSGALGFHLYFICAFLSYDKFFKPIDWLWDREIQRLLCSVHICFTNKIAPCTDVTCDDTLSALVSTESLNRIRM